jgi:histidinol-phosphate aminotransferase
MEDTLIAAPAPEPVRSSPSAPPALPEYRPCLRPIRPYVPGGSAEDVAARHAPERISKLGSNENPLGPGPLALEAVRNQAAALSVYPDAACAELAAALASHTGMRPGNFLIGNGSDEVLMLLAATYLNPGDRALVGSHTFFNYEFVARLFDAEVVTVPAKAMRYDLPAFSAAAAAGASTRMAFLCNPNNPTGSHFTHDELSAFLAAMPRRALIVVDEAYREYVDPAHAPDFPDTLALMERHPNLVVTRTFSKAHGLAALRVGYAVASEAVIADARRTRMPFSVNLLAQKAAVAALRDRDHLERTLRMNREGKAFLAGRLAALGCEVLPSQANFLCFRPPWPADRVCDHLFREGVIVRPLSRFGLDGWIRVTVGRPDQNGHFLSSLARFRP